MDMTGYTGAASINSEQEHGVNDSGLSALRTRKKGKAKKEKPVSLYALLDRWSIR